MDNKQLLIKAATLLYRESQLPIRIENSSELVRTIIEKVKITDIGIGYNLDRELLTGLKDIVLEMCRNDYLHDYSITDLLQRFKIILSSDEKLYEAIEQGMVEDLQESQLKRNITNIKKSLNNHFKEQTIGKILDEACNKFKFNRDKIKDINMFVSETIAELEPLQINTSSKDPAVLDSIDIGNTESMKTLFNVMKNKSNGLSVLKTGWIGLNRMLQGGFRRGEFTMIAALQHKYKTGFTLSLFKQIALYNTPSPKDPTKRPLLIRFSFEDDLNDNLLFLYQNLKYNETNEVVDLSNVPSDEMAAYVTEKLQVNGYHVKFVRVDPTQWTYRNFCNAIVELEAQGYEIELAMLDYLAHIPTTGCSDGPPGTALRDMFRRVRNFCASRNIAVITPHQLSTEAKMLSRSGLPDTQFVKNITEKGYYSDSKQLDQEVDLELYIHIAKVNNVAYLTIQRGKHRIPTILSDSDKYMLLKFPNKMPIPDDILSGEDSSYTKVPTSGDGNTTSDDLFKL
jgi:hypothetical protein